MRNNFIIHIVLEDLGGLQMTRNKQTNTIISRLQSILSRIGRLGLSTANKFEPFLDELCRVTEFIKDTLSSETLAAISSRANKLTQSSYKYRHKT